MYRARKSTNFHDHFPRANDAVPSRGVSGNFEQSENEMPMQRRERRGPVSKYFRSPKAMTWYRSSNNTPGAKPARSNNSWHSVNHDAQVKPLVPKEDGARSSSSFPPGRNTYNSMCGIAGDMRAAQKSKIKTEQFVRKFDYPQHQETKKILHNSMDMEGPGTLKERNDYKGFIMNPNPFNHVQKKFKSFSETVISGSPYMHQDNIKNNVQIEPSNSTSTTTSTPPTTRTTTTTEKTTSVSISVSLPSIALGKSKSKRDEYIFDTSNPSAFENHDSSGIDVRTQYTFGFFDNSEDYHPIFIPIRNPRDPPTCDKTIRTTKTDGKSPIKQTPPPSPSLPSPSQSPSPPPTGDTFQQFSLLECVKQQINILKAGNLSVNQLYILDLIEDQLVQYELSQSQQTDDGEGNKRKYIGFLDIDTKNKQIRNFIEKHIHSSEMPSTDSTMSPKKLLEQQQQQQQLEEAKTQNNQDRSKDCQHQRQGPQYEAQEPKEDILIDPEMVGSTVESLKKGEKNDVEVELRLNKELYDVHGVQPKTLGEKENPKTIFSMEDMHNDENNVCDQFSKDTVHSEGESSGLHQSTEDVKKVWKPSGAFRKNYNPNGRTNWMNNLTYTHITSFSDESKPYTQKYSKYPSQMRGSYKSGYDNNNRKSFDGAGAPRMAKSSTTVESPKNKKKFGRKFNPRR